MKGRKISIDGVIWTWRFGRSHVIAQSQCGRKIVSSAHIVKGVDWQVWERGQWKNTSDGRLTPRHVEKWIRSAS